MLEAAVAKAKAARVRRELAVITSRDESETMVTCEGCGLNSNCEFAWDLYNTDGDCLAEK